MADNYLEKKMDDLRSGRLTSSSVGKRTSRGATPKVVRPMEGLRVVVTGGARGIGRAIVEQFRKNGASVDIVDIDRKNGMATAQ